VPDTSNGIRAALEHMHRTRRELGGSSLDMASAEMQLGQRVGSEGLDRAYSVAEQLAGHMTRNIADTLVRSLFLLAHATLRLEYDYDVPLMRNGDWYVLNPSEWRPRQRLTIKVGMSPSERQRRMRMLEQILQSQMALAQVGMEGSLVTVEGYHAALVDWARTGGITNPERYFVDPRSEEGETALRDQAANEQRVKEMQERLVTQAIELEQIRALIDKYKADQDTQYKYWATRQENIREEARIVGAATTTLIAAQGKQSNGETEAGQSRSSSGLDNGASR
jgi:hypothetical protein